MRPNDIHVQVKQQPFVPLRMHFSDGSAFDIPRSEFLRVTHTVLELTVMGKNRHTLPERVLLLDPGHVVRLEPINGQESK